MKKIYFTCDLPNGIHARPASHIESKCNKFISNINWKNNRTGIEGDAKSVLSIIGTDTLLGDQCELVIEGQDQDLAFEQLQRFILSELPLCDSPTNKDEGPEQGVLPRNFTNLNPQFITGRTASSGFAKGKLLHVGSINFDSITNRPTVREASIERKELDSALTSLVDNLSLQIKKGEGVELAVIKAHLSIVNDKEFQITLSEKLEHDGSCADAIIATAKHYGHILQKSSSQYLRERELDIRDICFQLLCLVYGEEHFVRKLKLNEATICIAKDLTPSQFLDLDKNYLKGLILTQAGKTSHTVILARSFSIPTVVGINNDKIAHLIDHDIFVDSDIGVVVTDISEPICRYYEEKQRVIDKVILRQKQYIGQKCFTSDGTRIEVAANIALDVEVTPAFTKGAEGIGLFRTEMLYMDRDSAPSEEELYNIFSRAIIAAKNNPIIIRTIDIGGDKPVDYLGIPEENNPFLGYRAVRIYEEFIDLFKTQLRSILRASVHGAVKIMVPMISSLEEIIWVKKILAEVRQELHQEQLSYAEEIPLGIMVEVPSTVFIIDQFCKEIDFFSIGSNDLTQYLMAVDRDNAKVEKYYNSLNPAFLRTLKMIVDEVHLYGKWVGLCGELGANTAVLPLLVGLGLDELSMGAPSIPATKERIAKLDTGSCKQLLKEALNCGSATDVESLLRLFRSQQEEQPIITQECISLDYDFQSKEQVIKFMSNNLYLAGRCQSPDKLADDIWTREDVFSTGLGFGFAIPHTKSEHIEQSTISVSRLANPIKWGEDDVKFVIMLTINKHSDGDLHMKIFSKLARKIMHAQFRQVLMDSSSVQEVEATLKVELEI